MASGPITSWQIDVETVTDFIFGDPKITADGDCSREIMTLAPWKKSYDKPRQHIEKQRHCFTNKSLSSQGYGFSCGHVWMWEKKCECWKIDAFELVLEKTLESPLDGKEIQLVQLKEISLEYSLEGLVLKLKLQYFDHLMRRTDSFEKTLMLGKIEGGRRRG